MSGLTPLRLREAYEEQERTGEPQPIHAGRCEKMLGSNAKYGPGPGYCGKAGRWLVRGQIRCGEHKEDR